MNHSEILLDLCSDDFDKLESALSMLSGGPSRPPSPEIESRVLELIKHPDADIRHVAIWAAGVRWGLPQVLPVLAEKIEERKDELSVLEISIDAVGQIARMNQEVRLRALRMLASVGTDQSASKHIRGFAYATAAEIAGKINPREYAEFLRDPEKVTIDLPWLLSLLED